MGCNGLQWGIFEELPLPPEKIALIERAAICGNGRIFEQITPNKNTHERVVFNGLQWEDF